MMMRQTRLSSSAASAIHWDSAMTAPNAPKLKPHPGVCDNCHHERFWRSSLSLRLVGAAVVCQVSLAVLARHPQKAETDRQEECGRSGGEHAGQAGAAGQADHDEGELNHKGDGEEGGKPDVAVGGLPCQRLVAGRPRVRRAGPATRSAVSLALVWRCRWLWRSWYPIEAGLT